MLPFLAVLVNPNRLLQWLGRIEVTGMIVKREGKG